MIRASSPEVYKLLHLAEIIEFFNLEPKMASVRRHPVFQENLDHSMVDGARRDIQQPIESDSGTPLKENQSVNTRNSRKKSKPESKPKLGEKRKRNDLECSSEAEIVCQSLEEELMIVKRVYRHEKELRESLEKMVAIQHSNMQLGKCLITTVRCLIK